MSVSKDLTRAKQHLQPNETIIEWSSGLCESTMLGNQTKRNGIVLATDRRVFVFVSKMFNGFQLEEFPLNTMTSIEYGKSMFGHSVKFISSGNTMKITMMSQGNPKALVDYVRGRISRKDEPHQNCPKCGFSNNFDWQFCGDCGTPKAQHKDTSQVDLLANLERLVDLHDRGLLTLEEFQQAKTKLLL
jgi:ribosomal protein S27AE